MATTVERLRSHDSDGLLGDQSTYGGTGNEVLKPGRHIRTLPTPATPAFDRQTWRTVYAGRPVPRAPLPSPEWPTGSSVREGQIRGKVAQQPDPHTNRRAKPGRSEDQLAGLG